MPCIRFSLRNNRLTLLTIATPLHLLLGIAWLSGSAAFAAPPDPPNIIWFFTEDNGPFHGCYGDPDANTPNIDQLAADGIRFSNAFANSPVCSTARFAIITGQHNVRYPGAAQMRNLTGESGLNSSVRYFPEELRAEGYYTYNDMKKDYNPEVRALDEAAWDRFKGNGWRDSLRPAGAPFYGKHQNNETHESKFHFGGIPGTARDLATLTLPPFYPDTRLARAWWAVMHDKLTSVDNSLGRILNDLANDGLLEDTIVIYSSDHGGPLPSGKRHCNDFGLRVPLIVRIPENYAHLFSHAKGSVVDEPVSFLDFSKTILSLAGANIPTALQGRIFLGPNKEPAPNYVPFYRNRMDERLDLVRGVHNGNYRYIRNFFPDLPEGRRLSYRQRNSLAVEWRNLYEKDSLKAVQSRFHQPKPSEELYDIVNDRWHTTNLADDPAYATILNEMRAATDAFIIDNNDVDFIPEASPYYNLADAGDPTKYPLQATILDLAKKASSRDAAHLGDLTAALSDPNYIVRYWGCIGLAHLKTEAASAAATLETLLSDPEPRVAIAAAWALCKLGQPTNALNLLAAQADSTVPFDQLFAFEVIDNIGAVALPILPDLQSATGNNPAGNRPYNVNLLAYITGELEDLQAGTKLQTPFSGSPQTIPGTIEVEDYDVGKDYEARLDADSNNQGGDYRTAEPVDIQVSGATRYTGWNADGEYQEFTVNVEGGEYNVALFAASDSNTPGSIKLYLNLDFIGEIDVTSTGGWTTFQSFPLNNVSLAGGEKLYLRVEVVGSGINVDKIEFTKIKSTSYQGWSRENFNGQVFRDDDTGTETWLPTKDPDEDHRINLVEYAFDFDPVTSSVSESLPLHITTTGTNVTLSYPVRLNVSDLTYGLYETNNLSTPGTERTIFNSVGSSPLSADMETRVLNFTPATSENVMFFYVSPSLITP